MKITVHQNVKKGFSDLFAHFTIKIVCNGYYPHSCTTPNFNGKMDELWVEINVKFT